MKNFVLIIANALLVIGCSQQPSSSDVEDALNSTLHGSCTMANVANFEKINGLEKTIEGNKYYSVDAKFDVVIKYDKEWSNKYLEHKKEIENRKRLYDLSMIEVNKIINEDVKVYREEFDKRIKEIESLNLELRIAMQNSHTFNSSEENGVSYSDFLNGAQANITAIEAEDIQDWKKIESKFILIVEKYNQDIGVDKSVSNRIDNPEIRKSFIVPYDYSKQRMQPDITRGCGLLADGFAGEIIKNTIYGVNKSSQNPVTPDRLYDGISQGFSMSVLLQKSENGWIIAE